MVTQKKTFPNLRLRTAFALLICLILFSALQDDLHGAPYDLQRKIPLRFTYQGADTLGWAKDTGWQPLIPFVVDFQGYLSMGNVPLKVSVPATLVMECSANQIYAGNQVPCRAWIESADDADVKELSSNYGFSLGIKFQDWWSETELANIGKDFALKIEDDGRLPLGSEYLCGMDTIEFASLPVDWLIPGSGTAAKTVRGIFSSIGDSGVDLNMASLNIAGELVVEGNYVRLIIANSELDFHGFRDPAAYPTLTEIVNPVTLAVTGFNDPNVKPFALTIPGTQTLPGDSNYSQESNSMFYEPVVQYSMNLYNSAGLRFTLVPPLSFNIMASTVDRGENVLDYTCPASSTLHDGSDYIPIASDFKISSDLNTTVSFPLTDAPDLPDLAVTELLVNEEPKGKVFVNEWMDFKFRITNIGNRDTQGLSATPSTPEPLFSLSIFVDGEYARDIFGEEIAFRKLDGNWIDRLDNPTAIIVKKGESYLVTGFQHKFTTEGPHTLAISIGYNEYKATVNGQPVYGIGDYHIANNYRVTFPLYVQAPRGTVQGVIETNPCGGDCGVNGVRVCLREASGGSYNECRTTAPYESDTGTRNGVYRFGGDEQNPYDKVPTGDYYLEYLPVKPTAEQIALGYPAGAYWAPRSYYFHHEGSNTDDFNYSTVKSGMRIYQYQNLKGYVKGSNDAPLSGVTVRFGDMGPSTTTDADGLFVFPDVPPFQQVTLSLSHPAHKTKRIVFSLNVMDSSRRETTISGDASWTPSYWDSDFGNTSGRIAMAADTEAPTLQVEPLADQGFAGSTLTFRIRSSDTDKETYQYRYLIYDGDTLLKTGDWTAYVTPEDPAGFNTGEADWTGVTLADKAYSLIIQVRDAAGYTAESERIAFTKDTVAPVVTAVLMDSARGLTDTTYSKEVDVQITINNTETGTLVVELSNDGGVTWSDPYPFAGTPFTIREWRITDLDSYSGPKTVTVRVTDPVGNAGVGEDSIVVDTTGSVYLAWGNRFTKDTHVPLSIDIVPPDAINLYTENPITGGVLLGTPGSQYWAQKIIPSSTLTFNKIALSYSMTGSPPQPYTGQPSPLHVKIVTSLDSIDPTCAGCTTLFDWSGNRDAILDLSRKISSGGLPIYSFQMITLNQGSTYYLLVYTESASETDYYMLYVNDYGETTYPSMPSKVYDPINGWQDTPLSMMSNQIPHLSFQLWNNDPGQIRIAESGDCEALTELDLWQSYLYPAPTVPYAYVDVAEGDGWKTVCVQYRNLSFPSDKDRSYYASVFLDTNLPTATTDTVKLVKVDQAARRLYFDITADDASGSGPEWITWTVPGYERPMVPYARSLILDATNLLAFSAVTFTFLDRAGNESVPLNIPLLPEGDFFLPTLTVTVNVSGQDKAFTSSPTNNTFHFSAADNVALARILITDTLTGKTSEVTASGTSANVSVPVSLPTFSIDGVETVLDGTYTYSARAVDAAGNPSRAVQASLTLDRKAPSISDLYLTGTDGRATAVSPDMMMGFAAKDEIGPLKMRYRINGGEWLADQTISPGQHSLAITGPSPLPAHYQVDLELKDGAGNLKAASVMIRTNRPPATSVGGLPNGTIFTDSPLIIPSAFSDADGDALEAVWIIVRKADDQTIVVNTAPLYGSSGVSLSLAQLSYGVPYTWSARFLDSFGQWSAWSSPVAFTLRRPLLQVIRDGPGYVVSTGTGIECLEPLNDCTEVYDPGAIVNLTATPADGFVFTGWSGACSGVAGCRLIMDTDKSVTASFAEAAKPLPGDVDDSGEVGLSDAITALRIQSGSQAGSVKVAADVNIDHKIGFPEVLYILQILAGFRDPSLPSLTVMKPGNGTGTVTSEPAGINCGTDCTETYTATATVTLLARADSDSSIFTGWIGACTGTVDTCTVTVDGMKNVGAIFSLKTWVITPLAGPGGSMTPSEAVTMDHDGEQTFTITPSTGYHITDVLVDGKSVGAVTSHTFTNVVANHTIAATFARNTFTVTATAGIHGTIAPSGTQIFDQGDSQTFTITPDAGCHVADVLVNGISLGAVTSHTFTNISADHTITATFAQNTFAITARADVNGVLFPSGLTTVHQGDSQTFTITPAEGYHVATVVVDGVSTGAVTAYTFTNVTANHTISAQFTKDINQFTLSASAGANGTIYPAGETILDQGAGQTYTITPQAGWHVSSVLVDGTDVGPVTAYAFTAVNANHTIQALFAADPTFSPADLAWPWRLAGVTTAGITTAPFGTVAFDSGARVVEKSGTLTYPDTETRDLWGGDLVMDEQGILSGNQWILGPDESLLTIESGKVTESKDFMTFVGRLNTETLHLMTAMKSDAAFIPDGGVDLSGAWHILGYRSGSDERIVGPLGGTLEVDAAGEITAGALIYPDDTTPYPLKGSLLKGLVSEREILTLNSGQINDSRTLMTWTDAGKSAHDFLVAVKATGMFAPGNLEGIWYVNGLSQGITWWGVLSIDGAGNVMDGILKNNHSVETGIIGGEITLDAAGVIAKSTLTLAGDVPLIIDRGKMTLDRDMILWIMEIAPGGSRGIMILTRGRR